MIQRIKDILDGLDNIDGWLINDNNIKSSELFFIKNELDMNRSKKVHHIEVTVYKDFEENDKKFKGSSTTKISPTMDDDEIKDILNSAALSASFVKNEYYSLVKPSDDKPVEMVSRFGEGEISEWLPGLIDGIYCVDNEENGRINSSEFFINKIDKRILNSAGVDVSFTTYKGLIELITEWKEKGEEVELYEAINFSDYKPEQLTKISKEMLENSKERAIAFPMPMLKDIQVLLTGDSVKQLFNYYISRCNGRAVYEGISSIKIGDNVQGDSVDGDLINIKLVPTLENSSTALPYDNEGFLLKEVVLYNNGNLKNYHCNKRYADYLNIEPTGKIGNVVIEGGSKSIQELKKSPYLELISFSSFDMNSVTGDFGGEVRLGRYFDGEKIISVSGGSITGNIKDVHQKMFLSKELQQNNNFIGPKMVQLFNVSIAGV